MIAETETLSKEEYLLGWAMYLSEKWYWVWKNQDSIGSLRDHGFPLYAKTKAMVTFDRVIAGRRL